MPISFSLRSILLTLGLTFGLAHPAQASPVQALVPPPTVTEAPPARTNTQTQIVWFSRPSGTTAQCSLNGAVFSACSSPKTYTQLPEGDYTLLLRAVDTATAAASFEVPVKWTIDRTAPAAPTLTGGPASGATTSARDVEFTFTVEAGASAECKLDQATYAPCDTATSHRFSELSEGSHVAYLRATDEAGNTKGRVVPFTVDRTPPWPPEFLLAPPNPQEADDDGTVRANFVTTGGVKECRLDDAAWAPCTGSYTVGVGPHVLSVRVYDEASNVSDEARHAWTVVAASEPEPDPDPTPDPAPNPGTSPSPNPGPNPGVSPTPTSPNPTRPPGALPAGTSPNAPSRGPNAPFPVEKPVPQAPDTCKGALTKLSWNAAKGSARKRYRVKGSTATVSRSGSVGFTGTVTGCTNGSELALLVKIGSTTSTRVVRVDERGRAKGSVTVGSKAGTVKLVAGNARTLRFGPARKPSKRRGR